MRVLIDTNIVLDYLLEREPFVQDAKVLFDAINSGQVIGYVTATTLLIFSTSPVDKLEVLNLLNKQFQPHWRLWSFALSTGLF